jgi:hypothetical protein
MSEKIVLIATIATKEQHTKNVMLSLFTKNKSCTKYTKKEKLKSLKFEMSINNIKERKF